MSDERDTLLRPLQWSIALSMLVFACAVSMKIEMLLRRGLENDRREIRSKVH